MAFCQGHKQGFHTQAKRVQVLHTGLLGQFHIYISEFYLGVKIITFGQQVSQAYQGRDLSCILQTIYSYKQLLSFQIFWLFKQ